MNNANDNTQDNADILNATQRNMQQENVDDIQTDNRTDSDPSDNADTNPQTNDRTEETQSTKLWNTTKHPFKNHQLLM